MKLRRLSLLRYGHLADTELDFAGNAALYVVHGANEAGKSTALAAIADGLFGFGHRTDFDFLHGGPQLRVGFTLEAGDFTQAAFVRRKGRRDTLRDADDQVVPEEALRRFLGGAGRELFERSFGLDGERLREGGLELLRSGGEAGESLLASTGLANLRLALAQLDDRAKALVGDGRGRRRLSVAVEAWHQAQRAGAEAAIAPRAWVELDLTHTRAVAALARLQEKSRALAAEDSRLQRVRRVLPLLAELDAVQARLAGLADVPRLPPEAGRHRQDALAACRDAQRDADREAAEAARLRAACAALPQDKPALLAQDAIDALVARLGVAAQAEADLPTVRAAIAAHRAATEEALRDLGVHLAPEAARDAVPAAELRRSVQRLISQRVGLAATSVSEIAALKTARRLRDAAAAALEAAPAPASPDLLRRTIEAVRGLGPLEAELDRARHALAQAVRKREMAFAALPLWTGDLAALIGGRLPLVAEAASAASRLEAADAALAEARAAAGRVDAEIAAVEEDRVRVARGETLPTRDAIADSRALRDRAWRLIRRVLDGGAAPSAEDRAGLPGTQLPDAFETLRDAADRLADRRADEAQRVADFLAANAKLDVLRVRREAAGVACKNSESAHAAAQAGWLALWAPCGLVPQSPAVMAEWRRAHAELLRLAEAEQDAQGPVDELQARRDQAHADLAALLPGGAAQTTLAALLLRAESVCAAAEAAWAAHQTRVQVLAQENARLPALQAASEEAATALVAWDQAWALEVRSLGLPADASPDTAEAALAAWASIAETAPAWRSDERRIANMAASIAAFADALRAVQATLAEPVAPDAAPLAAARLARRLDQARKIAAEAEALTKQIAKHEKSAADALLRRGAAELELESLRGAAGVPDDAALEQAILQAGARDEAERELARLGRALLAQGDGQGEPALRTEIAGIEADQLVARLAEIQIELAALGEQREQLSAERTRAEEQLRAMQQGGDAAGRAQEAEDALAEARAAAELYARVHVARTLLRAGIERFRAEQQGPLLRAASAHFSLLTGGRYTRLGVDEDAAGRAVLAAVRADGSECPLQALSEGTRDQLYFALRVAAIESHAISAEPLPFIADDLLVHFDDVRADAALRLLAELGRTTQVILFTHHDHIAALAEGHDDMRLLRLGEEENRPGALPLDPAGALRPQTPAFL